MISPKTKLELEHAVTEYDYLNEYRELILFDDNLPIPLKTGIAGHFC